MGALIPEPEAAAGPLIGRRNIDNIVLVSIPAGRRAVKQMTG
jgi:hypothetical protein